MDNFKKEIINTSKKRVLYSVHALNQMNKPHRMISKDEVRNVINEGRIIENYPEDKRGRSCLLWGKTSKKRIIHIVCAPKEDYLFIITAYIPNKENWENNFKKRKES